MREPIPPCRECTDRSEGCWGKCEKYLEYKKDHDEWSKVVMKNKLAQYEQNDLVRQRFKAADKIRQKKQRGI